MTDKACHHDRTSGNYVEGWCRGCRCWKRVIIGPVATGHFSCPSFPDHTIVAIRMPRKAGERGLVSPACPVGPASLDVTVGRIGKARKVVPSRPVSPARVNVANVKARYTGTDLTVAPDVKALRDSKADRFRTIRKLPAG